MRCLGGGSKGPNRMVEPASGAKDLARALLSSTPVISAADELSPFWRLCGLPDGFFFSGLLTFLGSLLLTVRQPGSARHDREGINRARQIAEDLFKPKQQTTRAELPTAAPNDASSAEQSRRQPRIFAIPPVVPMGTAKVEPAAEPQQLRRKAIAQRETRDILDSQFGRVRTLTNYGMTTGAGRRSLWSYNRPDGSDH